MNDTRHVAPQSNWSCDEVRAELEGWALGALDQAESASVERHLGACEQCRQDAASLTRVAGLLPFSLPPVTPSVEARRALMSRIADEQMAVAAAESQVSLPRAAAPARAEPVASKPRYHWSQLLVTPLAIALLVMTLWSLELRDQVDDSGGDGGTSETVSMLPEGFQTFTMQSDCEKCKATGKLLADPQQASALMVAWDLDPSQVHQVWCQADGGKPVLVASLDVSDSGEVVQPLVFDQPISGYSRIYVVSHNGETSEIRLGENGTLTPSTPPLQRH